MQQLREWHADAVIVTLSADCGAGVCSMRDSYLLLGQGQQSKALEMLIPMILLHIAAVVFEASRQRTVELKGWVAPECAIIAAAKLRASMGDSSAACSS